MSKIGNKVIENLEFLKKLSRTKSAKKREQLFKEATDQQLILLVEICYNILKGYFPLTRKQKYRLLPYANFIRKLGKIRTNNGIRKTIQTGGGFVSFAVLLAPIIAEAIKNLTKNDG